MEWTDPQDNALTEECAAVASDPHSEKDVVSAGHHTEDRPEDWGWHGEWGGAARKAGWVVTAILIVMVTATHYNHSGSFWLLFFAAGMLVVMLWDTQRRKNAWRK